MAEYISYLDVDENLMQPGHFYFDSSGELLYCQGWNYFVESVFDMRSIELRFEEAHLENDECDEYYECFVNNDSDCKFYLVDFSKMDLKGKSIVHLNKLNKTLEDYVRFSDWIEKKIREGPKYLIKPL